MDTFASEINQKKSKIELIEEDLETARNDILSSRKYSLKKDFSSEVIDVIVKPYDLTAEQSPDWWSEKQAYDMSFLFMKAPAFLKTSSTVVMISDLTSILW